MKNRSTEGGAVRQTHVFLGASPSGTIEHLSNSVPAKTYMTADDHRLLRARRVWLMTIRAGTAVNHPNLKPLWDLIILMACQGRYYLSACHSAHFLQARIFQSISSSIAEARNHFQDSPIILRALMVFGRQGSGLCPIGLRGVV